MMAAPSLTHPEQAAPPVPQGISADEIALYDRQIRLWGMQAQEKIRNASILLITVKALGNEIAKNLVLAGIGSLTLVDNAPVTEDDLGAQFFITEDDVGKPRSAAALPSIQKLNPRVTTRVETSDILSHDPSYFTRYTLIIATDLSIAQYNAYNAAARLASRPFYCLGTHGLYGFLFADLIEHTYLITRDKGNIPTKAGPESATRTVLSTINKRSDATGGKMQELVTKTESYQPLILANTSPLPPSYLASRRRLKQVTPLLPCLRALWEFEKSRSRLPSPASTDDLRTFTALATQSTQELQLPPDFLKAEFLRSFMHNLGAELSPTCAFLGGMAAQDVVNVVSGKEQPVQNMLFFDGESGTAPVYALTPIVPAMS